MVFREITFLFGSFKSFESFVIEVSLKALGKALNDFNWTVSTELNCLGRIVPLKKRLSHVQQ